MGLKHFLLGSSLLCGLVVPVVSQAADALAPRAEVSVKGGSERSTLTTEFWAPLAQKSDRVVYTDLRLMGDDDDNREGNLGIGYRQIYEPTNSVLGIHGWIDRRRTEHNSTFHQVTLGVESLGDKLDLRINGYIPLNDGRVVTTPNLGSATPYLAGNGLFYDTTGSINETPQYGLDAEAGYRLPICESQIDAVRVYGGSYYFFRDNTESVLGGRARIEAQINQLVSIGARFQYDAPRGSQGFLEATLRFPFSAKKLYQTDKLRSRLDESPERDIDIVTASKVDNGLHKEITNSTGTQQRILYVDNTQTNGDGTKEHPFNNLTSAQAALQANDILYVFRGDGTTHNMDQGITISQPGVTLVGSGSALTVSGYTFLNAGQAPVLTNTQAFVDDFTGNGIMVTGRNASISGINVNGTRGQGIFAAAINGTNLGDITISNVTVTNSARYGVIPIVYDASSSINSVNLSNVTSSNNTQYGVVVQAIGGQIGQINLQNITTNNNGIDGIVTLVAQGGRFDQVSLSNITAINNRQGVNIVSQTGSLLNHVQLSNITADNNSQNGVIINSTSSINDITVSNVTSISNGQNGVIANASSGGTIGNLEFSNILSNNNALSGTVAFLSNSVIGNASFKNVIANNNVQSGLDIQTTGGGIIQNLNVSDSSASANTLDGLILRSTGTGSRINNTVISNITNNNNHRHGIDIVSSGNGVIDAIALNNITANNNTTHGISIQTSSGTSLINTLTVSNTTANSNGSAGTYLQAFGGQINNAQFSNYTGNSNTTYGFIAQATSAGVINNLGLNQTTTNNNLQQGLRFQADTNAGSQINALTISNAISNANLMGVYITTSGPGVINSTTLSNITANNNTQYGYFFNAVAGTMNNISLSSSNAVGNGIYGVYVNDDTTGPFLADLGGGTLGSIGQNRIYGNTSSDIRVDVDGGQLKAKNNWWGVNTGLAAGKVSYEDASTIDSTAFLTTDPRP